MKKLSSISLPLWHYKGFRNVKRILSIEEVLILANTGVSVQPISLNVLMISGKLALPQDDRLLYVQTPFAKKNTVWGNKKLFSYRGHISKQN